MSCGSRSPQARSCPPATSAHLPGGHLWGHVPEPQPRASHLDSLLIPHPLHLWGGPPSRLAGVPGFQFISSGAKVERGKELGCARPHLPSWTRGARRAHGHPPVEAWPWRVSTAIRRVRGPRHGVAVSLRVTSYTGNFGDRGALGHSPL